MAKKQKRHADRLPALDGIGCSAVPVWPLSIRCRAVVWPLSIRWLAVVSS
jgi:hypothetical protein